MFHMFYIHQKIYLMYQPKTILFANDITKIYSDLFIVNLFISPNINIISIFVKIKIIFLLEFIKDLSQIIVSNNAIQKLS